MTDAKTCYASTNLVISSFWMFGGSSKKPAYLVYGSLEANPDDLHAQCACIRLDVLNKDLPVHSYVNPDFNRWVDWLFNVLMR